MGLFVAACGSTPPSVVPVTPSPTPSPTPNPHLTDPASADVVFTAIARAKLRISANNAASGTDPVKKINATFNDWPMIISEYRSAATLAKAKPWVPGDPPGRAESPVAVMGLNILIEWGPKTDAAPAELTPPQVKAMNDFLALLDVYVGPVFVRTTTSLDVPAGLSSAPEPSGSAAASGKAPGKPSAKPTSAP